MVLDSVPTAARIEVTRVLRDRLTGSIEGAVALLESAPVELLTFEDESSAMDLWEALAIAGAGVSLSIR